MSTAQSSFEFGQHPDDAGAAAARLALPRRVGHFDELRNGAALRPEWQKFFALLGRGGFNDLDRRFENVARQINDDGITYNVYSDESTTPRPWSLELLPLVISEDEWASIERGITQRARLLNAILTDVYGPRRLLADAFLPPALIYGNPGYQRSLQGFIPPGGTFLHIAAFDLARAPDGGWWVVSQRTQAPSGLGYALENRLTISRAFPEAFRAMNVQRLAAGYRRLLATLVMLSPRDEIVPRIVLLTPGPYSETYFEHAYLSRYLGVPLVEGSDLTVRDDKVYLKSLYGLERVHGILRRLDDDFCDPLELRSDSALGVPGLLQAIRAGGVMVANALGAGFLESPAINGFLPAISKHLLGEGLAMPSLNSWWCGEAAARKRVMADLSHAVIKPTFPASMRGQGFEPVICALASEEELDRLRTRIELEPDAYTVQSYLPLSQAPTWRSGAIVPRAAMVRVFAIADANQVWHAMPGGLTRLAMRDGPVVSMQRGGSSADTWVLTSAPVDTFSMLPAKLRPDELAARRRPVSSRAAENLFWMGRYTERAENGLRMAKLTLGRLNVDTTAPAEFLEALEKLCLRMGLIPAEVPSPALASRVFERTLISSLDDDNGAPSVGSSLSSLQRAGGQIRDRLSPEHWRLIVSAKTELGVDMHRVAGAQDLSTDATLAALERLGERLAAITGAQTDRMTRDDGWRLLTIGRQVERLAAMSAAINVVFATKAVLLEQGHDLLIGLFDSVITYRSLYQRRQEVPPLIDLLILDPANPRSLACVLETVRMEIQRLPASNLGEPRGLLALLPKEGVGVSVTRLCSQEPDGSYPKVLELAAQLSVSALALSNELGRRYFSLAHDAYQALRL